MTTTTQTIAGRTRQMVCFSFAAYAKSLIDHLKSLNIPVLPGLTDQEFSFIESTFRFSFPPDLRSILQAGLPIGPHFPNWRSSSLQQLQILLNLPLLNLSKNISRNNFWVTSIWGPKPQDPHQSLGLAKQSLDKAPVLVPIYRNCYIPSTPNLAGNPVFYVDDRGVRVLSFDVTRFFQEVEFLKMGVVAPWPLNRFSTKENNGNSMNAPAWAATTARNIEFWTEAAESGRRIVAREETRGWWIGGEDFDVSGLRDCLEEVFWRLRDGGWGEEEVREMMMMDGCDDHERKGRGCDRESVTWHTRVLSLVLLRAGWSREDVVDSLDVQDCDHVEGGCVLESPVTIQHSCSREDDARQNNTLIHHFIKLHSLEV